MIYLKKSLAAWQTEDFSPTLKTEVAALGLQLPLQQGLTSSSYALDEAISVVILNNHRQDDHIHVHAGIFYTGMIAGCNCADDPSPADTQNEYCEVDICIRCQDAASTITLSQPE